MRELRKKRALSQERPAHAAGLDRTYVQGIDEAAGNPSLKNIVKIARALEVEPAALFKGM